MGDAERSVHPDTQDTDRVRSRIEAAEVPVQRKLFTGSQRKTCLCRNILVGSEAFFPFKGELAHGQKTGVLKLDLKRNRFPLCAEDVRSALVNTER